MAAAIVYEGVVGGGDLFQGMKFFMLERVPDRSRWKGLLEVGIAAIQWCNIYSHRDNRTMAERWFF
jgi:hypothetical protein